MIYAGALRQAGIKIVKKLSTLEVNKIASNISEKICVSFPEHKINQSDLFISIARLNMYLADFNDDSAAKYWYKNNSIYFKQDIDFNSLETTALHECLHLIQTVKNKKGKVQRLGLYTLSAFKENGFALNEAAVQLMASYATFSETDSVKYYGLEFITNSPNYYPIECALVRQMAYFTGNYPLFHSVLYSDDIFKNTFIMKSSEQAYYRITNNLDDIVELQELLSKKNYILSHLNCSNPEEPGLKKIKQDIENIKSDIKALTLYTQELILTSCAYSDLNLVRDYEGITTLKKKLYKFKNVLITTENYTFFNEFYCHMMEELEEKKKLVKKYGVLNCFKEIREDLSLLEVRPKKLNLIQLAISKIKELLNIEQENTDYYTKK